MVLSAPLGSQARWLRSKTQSETGVRNWPKHIRKNNRRARDARRKFRGIRGGRLRGVDRDVDSFGLLGIELEIAHDERAMRRRILAIESVEKPAAFHGILAGHRRWSGGFAGSGHSE